MVVPQGPPKDKGTRGEQRVFTAVSHMASGLGGIGAYEMPRGRERPVGLKVGSGLQL